MARGQYWSASFRSSDFSGESRRDRGRRGAPALPAAEVTDPCIRADRCSGGRRNLDAGDWSPAQAAQHVCLACRTVLEQSLADFPGAYGRLAGLSANPARSGRAVRVPPGSRVLVNAEADALMREASDVLGGWAARVRAVPQLSLSRHGYPHGSADQVREDCRVLALHTDPLLALDVAPALRTWTYLPGKASARPQAVPCRRCGLPVSPAPSGKRWWPAVCSHPSSVVAAYAEDSDGNPYPVTWTCAACSKHLPKGFQGAPACAHEPSRAVAAASSGIPADVEDEIGDLEVVRTGDGWVTAVTFLNGGDAALDVIDLAHRAARLLRETPAPPETFDGIPCRGCEAMGSLERAHLPAGPEDPDRDAYSRCTVPSCREVMTRAEHGAWTAMYAAWTKGSGILVCARCEAGNCGDCQWGGCSCRSAGHAAA